MSIPDSELETLARERFGEALFSQFLEALRRGGDTHTPADVLRMAIAGEMQMYEDGSEPHPRGVAVTQIIAFPRATVMHAAWVFGDKEALLGPVLDKLVAAARESGCDRITGFGRAGWGRGNAAAKHRFRNVLTTQILWLDDDDENEETPREAARA